MKTYISMLLFLSFTTFQLKAQISTLVIDNKLVIPENPIQETLSITKNELSKVEMIASKLGEIKSYLLVFKIAKDTLVQQQVNSNKLSSRIRERMLQVPSTTMFFLENVAIDLGKKRGVKMMNYQFIITE